MSHETRNIRIKGDLFADVDIGMIAIVNWLNSLPGVETDGCCEGDPDGPRKPYVLFHCDNPAVLWDIAFTVSFAAWLHVSNIERGFIYGIHFESVAEREQFVLERLSRQLRRPGERFMTNPFSGREGTSLVFPT